jgi:branched-chain amino acid transport system ATP-binding protein
MKRARSSLSRIAAVISPTWLRAKTVMPSSARILQERRNNPGMALSGGQQQMLAIGRALISNPAAGLTMEESLALAAILRDLATRWGVTVLLVEHDMQVVFSVCDRISVLHLGRALAEGTVAEVRADKRVIDAYLGSQA